MNRFVGLLCVFSVLVTARAAAAAESASFWLEARPWTCSQHIASVARELSLACDAAGGACKVAGDEASADRRIVIKCDHDKWMIEAHDANGSRLWAVDVAGEPADRARSAAVFAVRAETGERLPAPSASPAIAPSAAASRAEPSADHPTDHASDRTPTPTADISMSFAPRAAVAVGNLVDDKAIVRDNVGGLAGFAIATTWKIDALRLGPTAGGDFGLAYSGHGIQSLFWHTGVVAAFGAPFERKTLGLMVEGGYVQRIARDITHSAYVRPAIIVQLARQSPVRPFLAVSYQMIFGGASHDFAGADLGVSWDL